MASPSIADSDLPALFQESDHLSIRTRRNYFRVVKADLTLLVLGAALAGAQPFFPQVQQLLYGGAALLLFTSVILMTVMRQWKFETTWYEARAVAESVKTVAWRYMMCAPPFDAGLDERTADKRFKKALGDIMRGRRSIAKAVAASAGTEPGTQLSSKMTAVRQSSIPDRKAAYLDCRIQDQRRWYRGASRRSDRLWTWWSAGSLAGHMGAFGAALFLVMNPLSQANLVGLLSTAAVVGLSWTQMNRFEELAESYGIAAQELDLIVEDAKHIASEAELARFVSDAETAISREHTLWAARREVA